MTNDTCEIRFLPGAEKALRKIRKSDPGRLPLIDEVLEDVLVNGWILSVHSATIKVLDQQLQIGEIRDLGSGGYRMFFFWHDSSSARTLYITALEKKSKLAGKARVNGFIDAADALRRRHFGDVEERDQ
ncbi:hypothetical protein [Longimicrobium sp.]|uniref:hypothetical protein n=1 Tax=Longimicrobium sp. TaxID=2029185 RepID=UPI003B3AB00B